MTYIHWRDIPILVTVCFGILICIFTNAIIPIVLTVRCAVKLCCQSYSVKFDQCILKAVKVGPKRAHALVSCIFKIIRREKKHNADKAQVILFGYIVDDFSFYQFLVLAVYICCFAFIEFWDAFLIHTSYSCNVHESNLDCFSKITGTHINCFNSTVEQQAHVVCFKFSYDIGSGLAKASIFFVLSAITSIPLVWFLLRLSGGASGNINRRCCTCFIQLCLYIISNVFYWICIFILKLPYRMEHNYLYVTAPFIIAANISTVYLCNFQKTDKEKTLPLHN